MSALQGPSAEMYSMQHGQVLQFCMSGKGLAPASPRVWPVGTVSTDTRRPDDFKDSKANEATSSHDLGRGNRKDSIRFDSVTGALG